ncbi:MAG: flavodoxin family protein [Calditrichaeota bacterium]|nr:flavodoxin family protein [Calditrichota bacterium]
MKITVVYDSYFGNTEQIGRTVGNSLKSSGEVKFFRIKDVNPEQVKNTDVLIIGSPTRAFRPTKPVTDFLNRISPGSLKGVSVAAFDTRISRDDVDSRFVRLFMKLFGYAAEPVAKKLIKKGGIQLVPPEGFYVKDTEGPLKDGESDRAVEWAGQISEKL